MVGVSVDTVTRSLKRGWRVIRDFCSPLLFASLLTGCASAGVRANYARAVATGKLAVVSPASPLAKVASSALWVEPTDGVKRLIKLLDRAQKQIFVEDYILTDRRIVRALERAQAQSVKVYVLLEPHPFGMGTQPRHIADELRAAGIAVRWSSPRFALTHAKLIVLDDSAAVISTANFSLAGFSRDRDFLLADRNRQDVLSLSQIFRSDWDHLPVADPDRHLVVSPVDSRTRLQGLMRAARRSIDVYSEELNDAVSEGLLAREARAGIRVRVILPAVPANPKSLSKAGVRVRIVTSPYIHAKAIVVDDSVAFLGSENLSEQSLDRNREVGLLFSGSAVTKLESVFSADWRHSIMRK